MIESADWLCEKCFGSSLIDKEVDILDPATGTGTFITELLEHFRGQPIKLKQKYLNQLHSNEVAILPYYVANLNIEATYAAITGEYLEYPNLCFVDTLDNVGALRKYSGHTDDLFGSVSEENVGRIRRQNSRRISVVIGNPPYNANQLNENENNKNREYQTIDARIKETYIAESTAQKTKLYDMYARFFRWASDRLDIDGILAFITNRSFIDSRTYDGFRKVVGNEFSEIYIIDLGGDVRLNPKLSGTKHNVFGIQIGVAISFMIKRKKSTQSRIFYLRRPEFETAEEKLNFLSNANMGDLEFEEITPDAKHNWINLTSNDFDSLIPLAAKSTKASASAKGERAIFKLFSLGVVTARDEWVYDLERANLQKKVHWLIDRYNADRVKLHAMRESKTLADLLDQSIKWSRAVKNDLRKGVEYRFDAAHIVQAMYRPYVTRFLYFNKHLNEVQYRLTAIFGKQGLGKSRTIVFTDPTAQKPFMVLAVEGIYDLHLVGAAAGSVGLPFHVLSESGDAKENITDWALKQIKERYPSSRGKGARTISKEAIFHYVYALLHDPVYRETYAQNLKREMPRCPLLPNFWEWADSGQKLMDLHVGYGEAAPAALQRTDVLDNKVRSAGLSPRVILKADKEKGTIVIDSETVLENVPSEAWEYTLGSRSALEWILDQYRESKPKDDNIRANFDNYRFVDHKEKVIDSLLRITTVSLETMRIIRGFPSDRI